MSKKRDMFKFSIEELEFLELDENLVAHIYTMKSTKNIPESFWKSLLQSRLELCGYGCFKITNKFIIVYTDMEENKNYVCLWFNRDKEPIFLCNDFTYNPSTVKSDLQKLVSDWLNIQDLQTELKNLLNKSSKSFKDYTITEDDDKILISIKK